MVSLEIKPDDSNCKLVPENNRNKQNNIRILLVDDQNSIRQYLHMSLEYESDLKIVGSAANGETAVSQVKALRPDIAIIDIEMPGTNGLETTQIIKEKYPNTKVIIFSSHGGNEYIEQALEAGAKGYLLKHTPASEIVHAIQYVQKGYLQLGPRLFDKLEPAKLAIATSDSFRNHNQNLQVSESNSSRSLITAKSPQRSLQEHKPASDEWSSMTKELVDNLPRVWTRGLLYFMMIFVGIILPWAMLSKVDETGSARGKLEPQGKVFTVDAPVEGTVAEVMVTEGQLVYKKQPLVRLESKPVESERRQIQAQLEGQQKELIQLNLLRSQLVLAVDAQKQQNISQQFEKQVQLDRARQEIQHNQKARSLAEESYNEAKKEVKRYLKAKNQGIVSGIKVVERKDLVREKERLLEQSNSDTEQAQFYLQEQEESYQSLIHSGEIAVLKSREQLKQIEKQIGTLSSQIKENQSQMESLNYQLAQRIVKAPVNGFIFQLSTFKAGSVLQPGGLVAEIAPKQSSLILKAQMHPTESGSLDLGMPVKLKFDAYPFQDFGIVEGKLINISPTTKVVDTEQGKTESYELEVKLNRDYIQAKNKRVALRPGQTATVEVILRQRRLIDFVLDPFKKLNKDGLEL
jgi:hemolysin D